MSSAGRRLNPPSRPTQGRLMVSRSSADLPERKAGRIPTLAAERSFHRTDRPRVASHVRRLTFLGQTCLVPRDLSDCSRHGALATARVQRIGQAMSYAPDSSVRTTGLVNETTNSNVLGPRRGGGGSRAGSGGVKGSGEGERTSRSSPPPALSSGNNTRDEDGRRSSMRRRERDGESDRGTGRRRTTLRACRCNPAC